ncbi:MAG: LytR/AlgR family response regulator transcription factor [Acutalibacteraceae bacterium]
MKFAIIDDEIIFAEKFVKTISEFCENVDIFTDPVEFLKSKNLYDLIFLDIDMPQINGIDLAKQYKGKGSSIVFVTNKDALVFDAYNLTNTLGFVRKSKIDIDLPRVMSLFLGNNKNEKSLTIHHSFKAVNIKYSDIIYIEKIINDVKIYTVNGNYTQRNSLTYYENILSEYGFIRTHIGFLVNIDYINYIDKNHIKLKGGQTVPVSRRNHKKVMLEFVKKEGDLCV